MNSNKKPQLIPGAKFGIFKRVFFFFVIVTLLQALTIGIYIINEINDVGVEISEKATKTLNQKTIETLEMQASEIASSVSAFLQQVESDLFFIKESSPSESLYKSFAKTKISPIWERSSIEGPKNLPLYKEISFISKNGQELIKISNSQTVRGTGLKDISSPKNTRYGVEDYFDQTKKLEKDEIYVSRLTGFFVNKVEQLQGAENLDDALGDVYYDGVIRFCAPIYKEGKFAGMVSLGLDHRHLMEFTQHVFPLSTEEVKFPKYKSGNYAFLFDDQGWIITHPKLWDIKGVDSLGNWVPAYTQKSTEKQIEQGYIPFNLDSTGFIHENYPIAAQQVRRKITNTLITVNVGGVSKIMAFAPIHYNKGVYKASGIFGGVTVGAEIIGFHTSAKFIENEIKSLISYMQDNLFLILFFGVLIVTITSWFLSREITKPIIKITEGANEIAVGSLSKEIEINRKDEIGTLAKVFNFMAHELRESQTSLLKTIDELKHSKSKSDEYAKELEYQIEIFKSIQGISNILGTTFNMNTVIRLILERCVKGIGYDRAILYLIDNQSKYLECTETYGFTEESDRIARSAKYHLEHFDCIETQVIKTGKIIFVSDFEKYKDATDLDKKIRKYTKSNSFVFVPLKVKEKIIGILGADKVKSLNDISEADINSLQILANQASRVIENTRLYQEIINQRNFVEDIFKYMQNGLITIDADGVITTLNDAAVKILNIKEDSPGLIYNYLSPKEVIVNMQKSLLESGVYNTYNLNLNIAGKNKYINIHASVVQTDQDTSPENIIILEDVTDKKQLDDQVKQLENLASLGRFAAKVAHEIRNPLTGISLFLDDLHDKLSEKPETLTLLEKALNEIERLEKLTHEILVYTHPSAGFYKKYNINNLIEVILEILSIQCQKAKITIIKELDLTIDEFEFNPDRMHQALMNIFLNSIEAMQAGGDLIVRTSSMNTKGVEDNELGAEKNYIKIEVKDNGVGIRQSEIDKVFEPFYSSKTKGSGLGLSTTYNIISNHSGSIRIDSTPNKGTSITIFIPVKVGEN